MLTNWNWKFERRAILTPHAILFLLKPEELLAFLKASSFLKKEGLTDILKEFRVEKSHLCCGNANINSYLASVIVDFLRRQFLAAKETFTFETVMSHPSKVELLEKARASGYRTYLYFVATDDPSINQSRVRNRVQLGGHPVPEDRIESRYHRSLALLPDAIKLAHRAYIFDNSGDNSDHQHTWIAEITDGEVIELKSEEIPSWFEKSVIEKLT